jgi:hypothetical protein
MALLYGPAERLTAENGGFRPGQGGGDDVAPAAKADERGPRAGPPRARPRCRCAPSRIRCIPDSRTYSVPLFLTRQCNRNLGPRQHDQEARAERRAHEASSPRGRTRTRSLSTAYRPPQRIHCRSAAQSTLSNASEGRPPGAVLPGAPPGGPPPGDLSPGVSPRGGDLSRGDLSPGETYRRVRPPGGAPPPGGLPAMVRWAKRWTQPSRRPDCQRCSR